MPGPAPKREAERRRRNKPEKPVEQVDGAIPAPDLDLGDDLHPLAASLYEALKASPEAAYMTPAAWQRARVSAHTLSETLRWREYGRNGMSSMMYTALQTDWKALLIDPAELRRVGIEVKRGPEGPTEAEIAATADMAAYRARLG
jgi:hypothetical protein